MAAGLLVVPVCTAEGVSYRAIPSGEPFHPQDEERRAHCPLCIVSLLGAVCMPPASPQIPQPCERGPCLVAAAIQHDVAQPSVRPLGARAPPSDAGAGPATRLHVPV
jgi:hypothetical protein